MLLLRAPADVTSVEELPADFDPPPLGSAADVRRRLGAALPDLDLSDPAWGQLAGPTWSIEVNIGADDPVASVMLHVRGSGDDVLLVVARAGTAVGGRALDCSTGAFLTGDPVETEGWHGFQTYRDRVLGTD